MSDTPRTDANYVCHYGDGLGQWVPREFACELERELAAAIAQRDKLVAAFAHLQSFVQGDLQEYDAAEVSSLINAALKECGK
jgi:hypothetical protein